MPNQNLDRIFAADQRRCNPQDNSKGQRHWNMCTKAHDSVVAVRSRDGVDGAFPLKPVYHVRAPTVRTQDSLDPCEFEKSSGSAQPRGQSEVISKGKNCNRRSMVLPLLSQEQLSDGIREATGSQRPMKDWHSLARLEQQIAKAIHENELILLENLLRLRKKLEENSQRERSGAAVGDGQNSEEERRGRRRAEEEKGWRESRVSPAEEQKRGSVRSRETARQDKGQKDIKRQRKKQDSIDRMRNTHEDRSRWDTREAEIEQKPQSKRDRVPQEIVSHQRMENGELNRQKWSNVKEKHQNRREGGDERDIRVAGETRVKSQQEKEKAKDRERNKTRKVDEEWTSETRYKEGTSKDRYGSNDEARKQGVPHKRQQKSACRLEAENHSGKGRASEEPLLAPVSGSSQSSRLQQVELSPEGADTSHKRLPCKICHRIFFADRLETHFKICEKTHQTQRKVFNSSHHRTKGTSLEEFLKTHPRSKTPERKNRRHNYEVLTRNMRQDRLPGGTSHPKPPIQPNPDYETCPHCSRRFAPKAAERHISKCQHIKSRPPPPRCRQ